MQQNLLFCFICLYFSLDCTVMYSHEKSKCKTACSEPMYARLDFVYQYFDIIADPILYIKKNKTLLQMRNNLRYT